MSYANPHFTFCEGGRKCMCNICGMLLEVPIHLYCSLDEFGNRRDKQARPEFSKGVYEFVAPKDYYLKASQDPIYFLCIEVSVASISSGLLGQTLASLRATLDYIPCADRVRIGICLFDT
mmetsp:Transcript_19883/g.9253  ORF Transcript_19883/g.9253 Transcript_19883/m.9253 type:complete len:120 (+) Transcript_19883:328-687(+)